MSFLQRSECGVGGVEELAHDDRDVAVAIEYCRYVPPERQPFGEGGIRNEETGSVEVSCTGSGDLSGRCRLDTVAGQRGSNLSRRQGREGHLDAPRGHGDQFRWHVVGEEEEDGGRRRFLERLEQGRR